MIELPAAFRQSMKELLGDDYPAFTASLEEDTPVSVRLHPAKPSTQFTAGSPVPWCNLGHYLPARPSFTLDPSFHAGAYYVQEASSMLIEAAFRTLFPATKPLRVLDLCAAPGGKSTLLASLLPAGSWLLANEVIRSRYQTLRYNLHKWGYTNTFTSNHDVEDFADLKGFFDLVLVDAPCSGEGLFRKDQAARQEWTSENVQLCAARQGRILQAAKELLAPEGVLFYSTCTYNRQENDQNAAWLATQNDLTYTPFSFSNNWGLEERNYGVQAYPHRLRGEGFFLAAFRKSAGSSHKLKPRPFRKLNVVKPRDAAPAASWIDRPERYELYQSKQGTWRVIEQNVLEDAQILARFLHRLEVGTILGEWKGRNLVPSAEWALSLAAEPALPTVNVSKEVALDYLRKQTPIIEDLPKGWALVQYQGLNLGWLKGLGHRYNNYYPTHWRIRM